MLFLEKGVGRESEGDLPGELSVAGGQSVDDTAVAAFFAASRECGGGSHQRDQHDRHLHLRGGTRQCGELTLRRKDWKSCPIWLHNTFGVPVL